MKNKVNCSGVGKYGNYYAIGPNDMKLALVLINGGPEHRKFLRQIFVSVDITCSALLVEGSLTLIRWLLLPIPLLQCIRFRVIQLLANLLKWMILFLD